MKTTKPIPNRDWVTPREAGDYLGWHEETVTKILRTDESVFRGAKQIRKRWFIPRKAVEIVSEEVLL